MKDGKTKPNIGSVIIIHAMSIKTFRNNPFDYSSHEEQYITNPKDIILLNYNPIELPNTPKSNVAIAAYELNYGKGKVTALGIYSDDILQNKKLDYSVIYFRIDLFIVDKIKDYL